MSKQMIRCLLSFPSASFTIARAQRTISTAVNNKALADISKKKKKKSEDRKYLAVKREKEKRRTRSDKQFEFSNVNNDNHAPVMLGEVIDVFSSLHLRSFVDCTLGAAGHSSAVIEAHPEMESYVGMDVDPVAHAKAKACINDLLYSHSLSELKVHAFLRNFKHVKSVISEADPSLLDSGVDAVLMDLGMSSMQVNNPERGFSVLANGPLDMRMDPQASLKAEDILNSWPETEIGRILKEYGEESNWYLLQKKIVQARLHGGLHSTGDLVDLIRSMTHGTRGGRQGWIKTATRVFQALRIAVNDELGTLEKTLNACFECLAPGGRLAVISFHSLEDRIVKQTFLKIIETDSDGSADADQRDGRDLRKIEDKSEEKETWVRSVVHGQNGTILTKRPISPSEEEEKLNRRSRSAKLRVIEKVK